MNVKFPPAPGPSTAAIIRDPLELLTELVTLPSVNPMGEERVGAQYFEGQMTNWLVDFFEQLEVPYEIQEVAEGRCNVIARLEANSAAPTIMLDAHQDTVPVEGMSIPPFQPVIEDGKLYGRGACDVKGGMAAMLAAFARLSQEPASLQSNVILSCTCDEEFTALGARHLAQSWLNGDTESAVATQPDVCLVAEPTDLNVISAHRGVVRWKIRTHGKACHSSQPEAGHSAIYDMARVVSALEKYAAQLPQRDSSHPLCGSPSLSIGRITGGTSVNIVPHLCEIEIDRRTVPGETTETVLADIAQLLKSTGVEQAEICPPWIDAAALPDENNQQLAANLLTHINAVAGTHRQEGAWYCTNASSYAAVGVPAVVFGPGSIAQAHTADEWIEIKQLYQASEIYYRFCHNYGVNTSW